MTEVVEFHTSLIAMVCRHLIGLHQQYRTEIQLANNKIADIVTRDKTNRIEIIEVKTIISDYLINRAWDKYHPFCHKFTIAAPLVDVKEFCTNKPIMEWHSTHRTIGLLAVSPLFCHEVRTAHTRQVTKQVEQYFANLFDNIASNNDNTQQDQTSNA